MLHSTELQSWTRLKRLNNNNNLYSRISERPLEGLSRVLSGQMSISTIHGVQIRVGTGLVRENAEGPVGFLGESGEGDGQWRDWQTPDLTMEVTGAQRGLKQEVWRTVMLSTGGGNPGCGAQVRSSVWAPWKESYDPPR